MSSPEEARFVSTRAADGDPGVSFERALLRGLAPDGGLYVPRTVPTLPSGWRDSDDLKGLARRVLPALVGADEGELDGVLEDALDFPVPLVQLTRERYVLELFHGPTRAFKDIGARVMARLMAKARDDHELTVLVATSGDTGSAVADAFAGLEGVRVVLLFPKGRVSAMQERQLTARRPGVTAFAVDGDFDDCQRLAKEAFADPGTAASQMTSANSINVGRLLPQVLYHLWGALQLDRASRREGGPLLVAVPSGNLGNLTAGVLAACMGLEVTRFLAAHNANDFFPRFLAGERSAYAFEPTRATLSNAMDVGAPSNFERLHVLLGGRLAQRVWGTSVDDAYTLERIRLCLDEDGYLACPHTAVGFEAVERYRAQTGDHETPAMVLATAHPAKFPDTVARATGKASPRDPVLDALAGRPTRVFELAPTLTALRSVLIALE